MYNDKDALGNPIVIGKSYGFSQSTNGITNIKFGDAVKITDKGLVTLDVFHFRYSVYNNPAKEEKGPFQKVAVKPILLFPIIK